MITYGKKKRRFALPRFLPEKKQVVVQPDPSTGEVESLNGVVPKTRTFPHDDSIDEMASMLLDDTINDQLKVDPGKRLSQISISSGQPSMSQVTLQDSKALPQLPSLLFNGDNAWTFQSTSVVTAAGDVNEMQFDDSTNRHIDHPGESHHRAESYTISQSRSTPFIPSAPPVSSTPPIPRKSSKRKSSRPKSISTQSGIPTRKAISKSASTPNQLASFAQQKSTPIDANHVNDKIQKMLAATKDLKGSSVGVNYKSLSERKTSGNGAQDGAVFHGPFVASKKRLSDYNMLSRVKTVISGRLTTRPFKKHHDSDRDDRLLDSALNDVDSEVSTPISSHEIGANERKNLRTKTKSKMITGCADFPRKPIRERALKQKAFNLTDDPFSSQLSLHSRTATESEHLLGDVMDVDESVDADDPSTPQSRYRDFDTLFTSSPEAQSTPRIRLEPAFGDGGRKTLKNVPADSRSLFDLDKSELFSDADEFSEMDMDTAPVLAAARTRAESVKRKSSQLKAPNLQVESPHFKRVKKHPSPSKADLEGWEDQMATGDYDISIRRDENSAPAGRIQTATVPVLSTINPNTKIGQRKPPKNKEINRGPESMPDLVGRSRGQVFKSAILSNVASIKEKTGRKKHGRQYSKHTDVGDGSEMDIDELQQDLPAYHISMGMGRL